MGKRIVSRRGLARSVISRIRVMWHNTSLSAKFAVTAPVVIAGGMFLIGSWVSNRIEEGVVKNAATAAQSYVDNNIAPHLQELAQAPDISAEHKRALDMLLSPQAASKPILSFRIWKGNAVVYSDRQEIIGKTFKGTPPLRRAWEGAAAGEFDHLSDEHAAGHPQHGSTVLEIYAPIHKAGTNEVIAVAETYEIATELRRELAGAQTQSWLIVGGVGLALIGSLFGIVNSGSRTIEQQRGALEQRVAELSRLLAENNQLRQQINSANQRMASTNERLLRRIGADLHDGPVQLVGLALLKLDDFQELVELEAPGVLATTDAPEIMRDALTETLREIRHLSADLAPPDIENLSVSDTLSLVAKKHSQRTGTKVHCAIDVHGVNVPFPIKTCIYRFAQEGLNNAYQHARGTGQALYAECKQNSLEIRVVDQGPGINGHDSAVAGTGQGLSGLRDRIESLGGTLEVRSSDKGTSLHARFALA